MEKSLKYYSEYGLLTNIEKHAEQINALTSNPEIICQIVQGLMVHGAWLKFYEIKEPYNELIYCIPMSDLLDKILDLDSRSLTIPRMPENRVVACCREFATLACAILRAKGIPARSRCGFAVYFGWKGSLEDHWIVEYWNGKRWVMNDPQLDPLQLGMVQQWDVNKVVLGEEILCAEAPLNPHDLKPNDFMIAGKAWQLCRRGILDPEVCGIEDLHGLWFVRGQLLRDFAALNKVEFVPHLVRTEKNIDWKAWRLYNLADNELTVDELNLLDHIAELSLDADKNLEAIQQCYIDNPSLNVPKEFLN